MSVNVVVPPSSISRHASRVPHRTKSGVTFLASAGKMNFVQPVLQLLIVGDAAKERHGGVCVRIDQSGRKNRIGPVEPLLRLKARVDLAPEFPRPRSDRPRIATAPFSITRCCAFSVMT